LNAEIDHHLDKGEEDGRPNSRDGSPANARSLRKSTVERLLIRRMRIEEPQLLAAMDRIERVIDVERDPFRDLPEGIAIKIDHRAGRAQQGASVGQVLKTGDDGL
jgi:hypothetical protein